MKSNHVQPKNFDTKKSPIKDVSNYLNEIQKFIKTHGSESRGQEKADLRNELVSYLQVAPL